MYTVIQTVTVFPWLFVLMAGAFVSFSRYRVNPIRYRNVLIAIGLAVGSWLTSAILHQIGWPIILTMIDDLGSQPKVIHAISVLLSLPGAIIYAISWAFIFGAAFGRQSPPQSRYLIEDREDEIL